MTGNSNKDLMEIISDIEKHEDYIDFNSWEDFMAFHHEHNSAQA